MSRSLTAFTLAALLLAPLGANAAGPVQGSRITDTSCRQCGQRCHGYDIVTCTIMEPALVMEQQIRTEVYEAKEEREETYTVFQKVAVKREIEKEICYLVDEVKTKTIEEKKCHLIPVPVTKVCDIKCPIKEIRDVTIPGCPHKGKDCDCPDRTMQCEVYVERKEQEVYEECEVAIATEIIKRDIDYCVKVPKKRKEVVCTESSFRLVPVERTRIVQVCVPKIHKQVVEVPVVKMMPKQIECCSRCAHKLGGGHRSK